MPINLIIKSLFNLINSGERISFTEKYSSRLPVLFAVSYQSTNFQLWFFAYCLFATTRLWEESPLLTRDMQNPYRE